MENLFRTRKYDIDITVHGSQLFSKEALAQMISEIQAIASNYEENDVNIQEYIKENFHRDSWVSPDNTVIVVYWQEPQTLAGLNSG